MPYEDGPVAGRVDVHHHFTAPAWLDWAQERGVVNRERLPWWTRWDLDAALEVMDKTGIGTAVMTVAMLGRFREPAERRESARIALRAAADVVETIPHVSPSSLLCSWTTWNSRSGASVTGSTSSGPSG